MRAEDLVRETLALLVVGSGVWNGSEAMVPLFSAGNARPLSDDIVLDDRELVFVSDPICERSPSRKNHPYPVACRAMDALKRREESERAMLSEDTRPPAHLFSRYLETGSWLEVFEEVRPPAVQIARWFVLRRQRAEAFSGFEGQMGAVYLRRDSSVLALFSDPKAFRRCAMPIAALLGDDLPVDYVDKGVTARAGDVVAGLRAGRMEARTGKGRICEVHIEQAGAHGIGYVLEGSLVYLSAYAHPVGGAV